MPSRLEETYPRAKPAHIARKAKVCHVEWMYHLRARGIRSAPRGYAAANTIVMTIPWARIKVLVLSPPPV
jgi:hypothetical protein